MRGVTDSEIVEYLKSGEFILFPHDDDFFELLEGTGTVLFLSRLPQGISIDERVNHWLRSVEYYHEAYQEGKYIYFEITPDGSLEPWETE